MVTFYYEYRTLYALLLLLLFFEKVIIINSFLYSFVSHTLLFRQLFRVIDEGILYPKTDYYHIKDHNFESFKTI